MEHIPFMRSRFGTLKGFEILFARILRSSVLQEPEEELLERSMIWPSIDRRRNTKEIKIRNLIPKK
jgi:hypothetical protein